MADASKNGERPVHSVVQSLPTWGRGVKRVMFVFGTRPEAIKLAPVIKRCDAEPRLSPVIVVVRQHHEILDQTLEVFDITPDRVVEMQRNGHGLVELTAKALEGIGDVIVEEAPDLVIVQGDTTTAYAAALAAFYAGLPVAHVEAGLRTNNLGHPYPEELNRQMISRIADMHFAPTRSACRNLMREGIASEQIVVTGNTVVDALTSIYPRAGSARKAKGGPVRVLATAHRRENWGAPLAEICRALRDIAEGHSNIEILFVVHPNPIVRRAAEEALGGLENISVSPPLAYRDFIGHLATADLILTDSGGIQEEAPTFGTPVVVLRETTERVEGIENGDAIVAGTTREAIRSAAFAALARNNTARPARGRQLYGDGKASRRIVAALMDRFFGVEEEDNQEVSGGHGGIVRA